MVPSTDMTAPSITTPLRIIIDECAMIVPKNVAGPVSPAPFAGLQNTFPY